MYSHYVHIFIEFEELEFDLFLSFWRNSTILQFYQNRLNGVKEFQRPN